MHNLFCKRLILNSNLLSQLNCSNPISYNNVKIQLNLRAKPFFVLNSLTRSQCLRSLQSSETENAIGHSRSNHEQLINTERPVDEEPKYKRSRHCDKPKKRRRRNDPNRKYAEQYSIERKIWREDLAQSQGNPLAKLAKVFTLTTLSRIRSMTTSGRIWILRFNQRTIQ